jgi:hypothetical protein
VKCFLEGVALPRSAILIDIGVGRGPSSAGVCRRGRSRESDDSVLPAEGVTAVLEVTGWGIRSAKEGESMGVGGGAAGVGDAGEEWMVAELIAVSVVIGGFSAKREDLDLVLLRT